ncbi:MAG: hypothetical protein HY717_22505 [Planctomycetes bacterium]|nr:hypothetical protein [Planctomycetota bacterium]
MTLRVFNTLGGKLEPFIPMQPGLVRMYHCGPTVKEPINLYKFRSYLLADVLRRYFEQVGLKVHQVMNITDVGHLNEFEEDVIELAAERAGKNPLELVQEEEKEFHEHRRKLNILDAHHYPHARDNIPEMLDLIQKLLDSGAAYKAGENIYFEVSRYSRFGQLAKKSLAELAASQAGARSRPHPEKRHPLDIDLWRTDALHEMHWPSPWGRGFPGWHLECVVMSRKYLGPTFDLHTGTDENIFPHHECEMAQAEAASGKPLARYWLHSAQVLVGGKPISRANQNLLTVGGLLDSGVQGSEIRAALLSVPYREILSFTAETLDKARRWAARWKTGVEEARKAAAASGKGAAEAGAARLKEAERAFIAAIEDDLNVPRAVEEALRLVDDMSARKIPAPGEAVKALERFDKILGLC